MVRLHLQIVSQKIRRITGNGKRSNLKKVDERLLSLLHKKSELNDSKIISTTHEQLANELGTARVVVSRLLKSLEEDGKL